MENDTQENKIIKVHGTFVAQFDHKEGYSNSLQKKRV